MAEYLTPGVHIAELGAPPAMPSLPTDIAGFVGLAEALPDAPPPDGAIRSAVEFSRHWSIEPLLAGDAPNLLWRAVEGFFANGGQRLRVVPVTFAEAAAGGHAAAVAGLAESDAAIIAAPDVQALPARLLPDGAADATMQALVALAAAPGSNRFAIIDAPFAPGLAGVGGWRAAFDTPAAALYWPWLQLADATLLPPSAIVAGRMAETDRRQGVWKAPAGVAIAGSTPIEAISDAEQELINPEGINAIRALPGRGVSIWGARTLSRDPVWRYIPVRRFAAMLTASIAAGLNWVVFEANGPALWAQVQDGVENFLFGLWRQGAMPGDRPETAFFVRCDASTMTADDQAAGRIVIEIGHAALKPAEFLVSRVVLATAG